MFFEQISLYLIVSSFMVPCGSQENKCKVLEIISKDLEGN
jgi:hypothetical protein